MGMADKPNRRAAAAAARELLRPKLDRITEIAEAARTIELAVQGPATTHDQRRRRSSARSRTTRPPVSGSTQAPTAAALDHPETEQEWANVIDGPLSTPRPDHAAGIDRGDGGAAFVDSVQPGTIG